MLDCPEPRPQVARRSDSHVLATGQSSGVGRGWLDRDGLVAAPLKTLQKFLHGALMSRSGASPEQRQQASEADATATTFHASGNFRAAGTHWDVEPSPLLP